MSNTILSTFKSTINSIKDLVEHCLGEFVTIEFDDNYVCLILSSFQHEDLNKLLGELGTKNAYICLESDNKIKIMIELYYV